jgi:adenosine deaminase/aminodeoxyfutalosine deaminase
MANLAAQPGIESIAQYIAALPKAELHVHLEGSVDADTLWELATAQRSPLAAQGREHSDGLYRTTAFRDFLQAFKTVCQHLNTPEDYELITYRALERLARQNVRYAEMILSAGVMVWRGQPVAALFRGAARGARAAEREFGIQTRWIFDAVRQLPLEQGWEVARTAADLMDEAVIGMGIGGDEAVGPERFTEIYQFAKQKGLRRVAHAGEAAGPESIWGALRSLGAERIGHGLSAAQDESLVHHLAEAAVPVEICLTSNVRTGGIADLAVHPFRHYFAAGIPVSLHTDDPSLFGTDLLREYRLAHEVFSFSREELLQLARNTFEAAFLSPDEKRAFLEAF